ncbi:hypothetical protein BgAZ_108880 [Babesia gibsoni]|uniref:Uncharacterized protein n=1 Tax=Babesia gibsoni TaxID=33632 RepID=A0AAD8PGY5_BABGI|nr:hypothetical protein BgAZ_108880 [Babesia gibsoni]
MRWYFVKPYVRWDPNSLLHYPESPRADIYGPNTIELRNLPMGRTPEYLQERLRRFFSKFGAVTFCRCMPHDLDPYQCNGTDKTNDPDYIHKQRHYIKQCVNVARDVYEKLVKTGPCNLRDIALGIYERNYYSSKWHKAGLSILMRFGSWADFLEDPSLKGMFHIHDGKVTLGLHCKDTMEQTLHKFFIKQSVSLDDELTVHWREGRIQVPSRVQEEMDELYHLLPLPVHLQLLSKSHTMYRMHDERHMLKIQLKQKRNEARRLARNAKKQIANA